MFFSFSNSSGLNKDMTISKGTSIFVRSGERAALSSRFVPETRDCTNGLHAHNVLPFRSSFFFIVFPFLRTLLYL